MMDDKTYVHKIQEYEKQIKNNMCMDYSKKHTNYNNITTKRSTIYNFELNKKYYIYKICYRW